MDKRRETMKRLQKTLTLLMTFMIAATLLVFPVKAVENIESVYQGFESARVLHHNISFIDIDGHWAKQSIQETAGLSLMRGIGNQLFQPERNLSHVEALTVLVKGLGLEEEAQRLGEEQAPPKVRDIMILSAVDNWAKGYIQVAVENEILTDEEVNQILNLTPQQQNDIEGQLEQELRAFQEGDFTPLELAALEAQARDKLISSAVWNQPVQRQQVAQWLARALQIEPIYGDEMVFIYQFSDWQKIDTEKIPLVEAVLQRGIMHGTPNTFLPRGELTRAQMAQLMVNIHDKLLEARGLTKKSGEVINVDQAQQNQQNIKLITIKNTDNSISHIGLNPPQRDFIVQNKGELVLSNQLRVGDWVRYYINENREVTYGFVESAQPRTVEGFVEFANVNNQQLILSDFNYEKHIFDVLASAQISINGRNATLEELLYGQEVEIILRGNVVTAIKGYLPLDPDRHGYISPGSRIKVGDVLFINSEEIEIRVDGVRERYPLSPLPTIFRSGNRAVVHEIKVGDRVMLSFDDIYSSEISTIRVEDDERHIDKIYRGTLEQVNVRGRDIVLGNVTQYEGWNWINHEDDKIRLKAEENVFFDGQTSIPLEGLAAATGEEVYVAVENSFGMERIAKLNIKQGSTVLYESTIDEIQFGTGRMILNNNSFNFHQGTIVVKNNRLVDILNLDFDQSIYIAADLALGQRNSAFIDIRYDRMLDDRIDGTRLVIYRGNIEDIDEYGVTVGRLAYQLDYLKLENNRWEEVPRRTSLTLTDDTYIFDSELGGEIDSSQFTRSRFIDPEDIENEELRDRVRKSYYLGKSAYFVVKETNVNGQVYSEVLGLNLTPHTIYDRGRINTEHSAIGEVRQVDLDNKEITLTNLMHWNYLSLKWESVLSGETVNMDKAVVLINDRPIAQEEFYMIRERASAYLIKNKDISTGDDAYILILEQ